MAPPVVDVLPGSRTRLVEFVDVRYRVASVPSALETTFAGTSRPLCEELDSCGVSGSEMLSLAGYRATLRVLAVRVIHRRVGRRRALSDFRAGRLRLFDSGLPSRGAVRLRIGEDTARAGVAECTDALVLGGAAFQGPSLIFDQTRRATITAALVGPSLGPEGVLSDALRTHCPGPAGSDILGASKYGLPSVASGAIGLAQLLHRRLEVSLSHGGSFRSLGYVGSRHGAVRLSLARLTVRGGTERLAVS